MKHLILGGLVAGLLFAIGCELPDNPPPPPEPEPESMVVAWGSAGGSHGNWIGHFQAKRDALIENRQTRIQQRRCRVSALKAKLVGHHSAG